MSPKKNNKKNKALKNIHSLLPKNLGLNKIKINPVNVIEDTKNKIDNFYTNYKKERQKEKKKKEKKRKKGKKPKKHIAVFDRIIKVVLQVHST